MSGLERDLAPVEDRISNFSKDVNAAGVKAAAYYFTILVCSCG